MSEVMQALYEARINQDKPLIDLLEAHGATG